jgi:hypothetical protein
MMTCSSVGRYQCFSGTCYLYLLYPEHGANQQLLVNTSTRIFLREGRREEGKLREVEIHVSEATNGEMAMSFPIFFYTHF